MQDAAVVASCCDRCAAGAPDASRIARRRLLKAAVFQPAQGLRPGQPAVLSRPPLAGELAAGRPAAVPGIPAAAEDHGAELARTVTGRIVDVSPHVIVLGDSLGEQRFALAAGTSAWRGKAVDPSALAPGDLAVIRLRPGQRGVADRVWANIGRVCGTIIRRERDTLTVDQGHVRDTEVIVIPARALGRIQVKFPYLHPGYLIDVIGLRGSDSVEGLQPATSQPPYRADRVPDPGLVSGHFPERISGSVTWYDAPDDPPGILGAAYPAIDPATGCAEEAASAGPARRFRTLPFLAVGSVLGLRNDCTGQSCSVPVTGCAPVARLFNDRCLECGTTERGRVAELTLASFVALGGELERGCFNGTISVGR
jgi:hypothetical protein